MQDFTREFFIKVEMKSFWGKISSVGFFKECQGKMRINFRRKMIYLQAFIKKNLSLDCKSQFEFYNLWGDL